MKPGYSLLAAIFLLLNVPLLFGQAPVIPEIQYENGSVIGQLPYGRQFYITGSTMIDGQLAKRVQVDIWFLDRKSGIRQVNREDPSVRNRKIATAMRKPPLISKFWDAGRTTDSTTFRVYIPDPLQFSTRYIIRVSFDTGGYFAFNSEESENLVNTIIQDVRNRFEQDDNRGGITDAEVRKRIEDNINRIVKGRWGSRPERLTPGGIRPVYKTYPMAAIDNMSREIGQLVAAEKVWAANEPQIKTLQARFDAQSGSENPRDKDTLAPITKIQLQALQTQQARQKALIDSLDLSVRREKFKVVSGIRRIVVELSVSSPGVSSVTDLNAIRVGTAFGTGIVALNPTQTNSAGQTNFNGADVDAFSYAALRFYFLPVDRRVVNPYLTNMVFINRLSFMFGLVTSGKLNYKGDTLQNAIGFNPVFGLSYDVTRYISLDLGMIMFKQQSLSPLTDREKLRVAPFFSIGFDADLFNRFSALFQGNPYKIPPVK